MDSDETILADIAADDEKPKAKRTAPVAAPQPKIEGDPNRKVWLRCVSELEPWADGIPLKYWQDYEVTIKDAALLEARRFVVIIENPKKG